MKKTNTNSSTKVAEGVSALLLVFFVHTAITTYTQVKSLANMLAFYTVNTTATAWIILLSEITICILLFLRKTRSIGFALAALFGVTGIVVMALWPYNPHHFGGIITDVSDTQRYFVYSLLAFLGFLGMIINRKRKTQTNLDPVPVVYT